MNIKRTISVRIVMKRNSSRPLYSHSVNMTLNNSLMAPINIKVGFARKESKIKNDNMRRQHAIKVEIRFRNINELNTDLRFLGLFLCKATSRMPNVPIPSIDSIMK